MAVPDQAADDVPGRRDDGRVVGRGRRDRPSGRPASSRRRRRGPRTRGRGQRRRWATFRRSAGGPPPAGRPVTALPLRRDSRGAPAAGPARPSAARGGRARRWWRLDAAVRERQQQPDDDRVGEQRRPAVADERQRDAGQRDELEVAGGDDERLDPDDQRQAGREQRPEVVGRGRRDAQAALDDDEIEAEDGEDPDQAELLAEGGEREVGVDLRDRQPAADRRQARPEPRPERSRRGRTRCSAWTTW